ncbi:MAG: electron transport complex subunit RsxB [Pseudohongiellaceae bacterium]
MNAIIDMLWFQVSLVILVLCGIAYLVHLLFVRLLCTIRSPGIELIRQVNALLPQTQCGQCGFAGCRPYARAIINGTAINKCPPGGQSAINALASLLKVTPMPLDPAHGQFAPRQLAVIREAECIGCTKCIQACPVDAILGAAKQMHTVIAAECTGCDLCVEPCPVDCIDMVTAEPQRRPHWPCPDSLVGITTIQGNIAA